MAAVSENVHASWSGKGHELPTSKRVLSAERQLALVDRVIASEARAAELAAVTTLTPGEQLLVEQQLQAMRRSTAWRVGRVVTIPIRAGRKLLRRVSRS